MVSNEQIKNSLKTKQEENPEGYLICDNCNSYYKLLPEESPEDFDLECSCGGEMKFSQSLETSNQEKSNDEKWIRIFFIICAILIILGIVGFTLNYFYSLNYAT